MCLVVTTYSGVIFSLGDAIPAATKNTLEVASIVTIGLCYSGIALCCIVTVRRMCCQWRARKKMKKWAQVDESKRRKEGHERKEAKAAEETQSGIELSAGRTGRRSMNEVAAAAAVAGGASTTAGLRGYNGGTGECDDGLQFEHVNPMRAGSTSPREISRAVDL